MVTLNLKDNGYRGIWYFNEPTHDEYVYKYSGGLGTFCAKHLPFAIYSDKVKKTFFCWGGTSGESYTKLFHMVSYYDHEKHLVPKPTVLLDKKVGDAHDNPVISMDEKGYIWIFSTSHGIARSSYLHRSKKPYNIEEFELIRPVKLEKSQETPIDNFSYMQVFHLPNEKFIYFFTLYKNPSDRTNFFSKSKDGVKWENFTRLSAIQKGHYQISAVNNWKAGTAFNFHPEDKGLNYRTNLYYLETIDFGKTWQTVKGEKVNLPITYIKHPTLIYDYQKEKLNVYLKDIQFDEKGQPVILYLTSKGWEPGPKNSPYTWMVAHWEGEKWDINSITTSDNNYDTGSLYIEPEGIWRVIAPTETGPQIYNPGGEVAIWISENKGKIWKKTKQITQNSQYNHNYVRRPVNAHPMFYAFWTDGNPRKPSQSRLYFADKKGNVYILPEEMKKNFMEPKRVVSRERA